MAFEELISNCVWHQWVLCLWKILRFGFGKEEDKEKKKKREKLGKGGSSFSFYTLGNYSFPYKSSRSKVRHLFKIVDTCSIWPLRVRGEQGLLAFESLLKSESSWGYPRARSSSSSSSSSSLSPKPKPFEKYDPSKSELEPLEVVTLESELL